GLGLAPRTWRVELDAAGKAARVEGAKVDDIKAFSGGLSFQITDDVLPVAPPPNGSPQAVLEGKALSGGAERVLRVSGLSPGNYVLKSGDASIASASAKQWEKGVQLRNDPPEVQVEQLRQLIVAKTLDVVDRWRPEDDTY